MPSSCRRNRKGLPISLLQAFSLGLPAVVTDVGGMAEVVRLAKAGFTVSVTDPAEMAASILRLASNETERKQFSQNAESTFHTRFTLQSMVNAYMDLYRNTSRPPQLIDDLKIAQLTAFSILLFTESTQPSGFFLKKKLPLMRFQCQQVNRKRSSSSTFDFATTDSRVLGRSVWRPSMAFLICRNGYSTQQKVTSAMAAEHIAIRMTPTRFVTTGNCAENGSRGSTTRTIHGHIYS